MKNVYGQPGPRSVLLLINLYLTRLDLDLCPYPLPHTPAWCILLHLSITPTTCWHDPFMLTPPASHPLCPISSSSRLGLANYTHTNTLLQRRHTYMNSQTDWGGGGLSGRLVTLPSLIPRQGLIDFPLSVYVTACPLNSPVITHSHTHAHEHVCPHLTAGIMKSVSYDRGGRFCCQMSEFAVPSFSWKLLSSFFSPPAASLHLPQTISPAPVFGQLQCGLAV